MVTEPKKNEIVAAIIREKQLLGSMNNVAKKLDISPATISANILKAHNWRLISDEMWASIAASLGVSLVERGWNLVQTTNMQIMQTALRDAQREGLFMAISEKAGSGKTASISSYVAADTTHAVYMLQCEEWSRKSFLLRLCRELGVTAGRYDAAEVLLEGIVKFFKQRAKEATPLLILDEADKLKPAALRVLIPLYNKLEDEIGLVACGTENLEKEIKNGVRKQDKGYDEIDSRLGRNFVRLVGSTRADVRNICLQNGIADADVAAKIFERCNPVRKQVGGKYIELCEDLRAVKRAVKAERLRQKTQ